MPNNEPPPFNELINLADPLRNQYLIPVEDQEIEELSVFKEDESQSTGREDPKGRRIIKVDGKPTPYSANGPLGYLWFFSLDGKDVMGPIEINPERIEMLEIDERPWGILIDPDDKILVSAWIES